MSEDYLYIDQGWVDALGLSREAIANLGLRELIDLCLERGFVPTVSIRDPAEQPGLHLISEVEEAPTPLTDRREG